MTNFWHKLLNPHCPECALERIESKVCSSCETLKMINAELIEQNRLLLDRLTKVPEKVVDTSGPPEMIKPKFIPWKVRQQMLENEARQRAVILKEAGKPDVEGKNISTEELEKELGVVEELREKTNV